MRRRPSARLLLTLASLAGVLTLPVTSRSEVVLTQISPKLSISGSLRLREEFWNWFAPTGPQSNEYNFFASVFRGAVKWTDDYFDFVLEAQEVGLMNLPDDAVAPAPQGSLGGGAQYFAHNRRTDDTNVFLRQGFFTLKHLGVAGFTLKGGRFEFSEGLEVLTKDPTLDWLKGARISQRLIGPFNFSHVGRSYDGLTGSLTRGPWNLTVMASHPTQGGFDLAGMKEIDDIDLLYAAVNLTRPEFAPNSDARFFYIYYSDGRGLLKTDNRPLAVRTTDHRDIYIHTEGVHWIDVLPTSAGPLDLLVWAAGQEGAWGRLDHLAWRFDLETGWQPAALPWKPWVRIGYGRSSGDDNPNDHTHETFFQILPTGRIYSWSTFYNLMNNEDAFAQLILRPIAGLVWRSDFHNIRLAESQDLWYTGAGATLRDRNVGFGYSGRPSFGHRDLFRVVESQVTYAWNPALEFTLYYGHLFGGDVVRKIFANDHADFAYLEVVLKL
jgi:hypothetical protein